MTLDEWLHLSGTSEKWLAYQVGVSCATINNWRHGRRAPGPDELERLDAAVKLRNAELTVAALCPMR